MFIAVSTSVSQQTWGRALVPNDGLTLGTIVNYACHPTTLAWENRDISPDYIGAMREVIDGIEVRRHWTYITPNKGFAKKTLGFPRITRAITRPCGAPSRRVRAQ
mgnify:CR=1 FL=1